VTLTILVVVFEQFFSRRWVRCREMLSDYKSIRRQKTIDRLG